MDERLTGTHEIMKYEKKAGNWRRRLGSWEASFRPFMYFMFSCFSVEWLELGSV
jgi:hypothetical protein